MRLSYSHPNCSEWQYQDNIQLPSKEQAETTKEYWARCCQELIQKYNLPSDSTLVIK